MAVHARRAPYPSSKELGPGIRSKVWRNLGDKSKRPYCGLRFSGLPIASRKIALLPFACGEKKLITSSSKKVSPVEPRRWAYAARYILRRLRPPPAGRPGTRGSRILPRCVSNRRERLATESQV